MLNATSARTSSSPFTATQWQELEHQALIFKYIVTGVPIPPELLYSVKRSLESSLASRLFPHQPIGWGCFQVGFGRKADPEPGRCRRTDGKKWRCSKEAYPDSKYCERHMHRGRNRSRKPVELSSSSNNTTPTPTTNTSATTTSSTATTVLSNISLQSSTARNLSSTTNTSPSSSTYSFSPLSSSAENEIHAHQNAFLNNPFLYPHSSSSSRPPGSAISPQSLYLDSGTSSHADRDYRYYGMREGLDERTFFPEASGNNSMRSLQDSYGQLPTSPYTGYNSHSQFQSFSNASAKQEPQQQHCFVLGTDFKSSSSTATNTSIRPVKLENEADQAQKPLHHFFDS